MYIFFLDTEGSGSTTKNEDYDIKIFSLAVLLSTYFVYNSIGCIDEKSISTLSLITKLAQNIAVATNSDPDQYVLSFYAPKFLWCLRDFTLEIRDKSGKAISSSQYLENALRTHVKGDNMKIRQGLMNFFKERDCVTLVRPVFDEKELQQLNNLPLTKIRPEFLNGLNLIRSKILAKCKPNQINGVNLSPEMYCAMVQKYIQAINLGQIPTISSAWDYIVEDVCVRAYNDCIDVYQEGIK